MTAKGFIYYNMPYVNNDHKQNRTHFKTCILGKQRNEPT